MMLLAAILVWVSILLAVYAYGIGMGLVAIWRVSQSAYRAMVEIVTDRAYGGDRWAIFMAAVVWLLLILLVFPLRAARVVWRNHMRQQRQAQKALTKVEERLFPADQRTSTVHGARDRLAHRALEEIETRVLGAPQPAELTVEERLIKLGD